MSSVLSVARAGPAMSVQDMGRPGLIGLGLSRGGAADRGALIEAAALLGLGQVAAGIEMAGAGGTFSVSAPVRFALTGAPMRAEIDGNALAWQATHVLHPGQTLSIGGALAGVYGYLTPAGGVESGRWQGSISAHLAAGVGALVGPGARLALGPDPAPHRPAMALPAPDRFRGGRVRIAPGPQTGLFDADTRARFFATGFRRGAQANRQGVALEHSGAPFHCGEAARLASDFVTPGDVQMTGAGLPYVLMSECQTIGGYPRIGTVLPDDLAIVAQAPLGAPIRFVQVSNAEADQLWRSDGDRLAALAAQVGPLVRDPATMRDLLAYQLISGVTCGDDLERT